MNVLMKSIQISKLPCKCKAVCVP